MKLGEQGEEGSRRERRRGHGSGEEWRSRRARNRV